MAGSIDLTGEERACIDRALAADARFLPTLASYLPYLAPVTLFGGYGVVVGDVTAVALALVCLIALNLWWIHSQGRVTAVFRSICVKIDAATDQSDREQGRAPLDVKRLEVARRSPVRP